MTPTGKKETDNTVFSCDENVIEFIEFAQAETVQDLLSTFKDIEEEIYRACGMPYHLMKGRRTYGS